MSLPSVAVVRTRDWKPRLRLLTHPLVDRPDYAQWRCTGRGETTYASTPEMAYRLWAEKVSRDFGRFVALVAPELTIQPWQRKVLRWLTAPTGSRGP